MGFIYMWENIKNGKKYIGKCQDDPITTTYIGSGKYFKRAVKKYGIENFRRSIIETCDCPKKLIEREKYWLDFYNAAKNPNFYNISPNSGGGHHGANYVGSRNPMYGKKHPNHKPHYGKDNGMFGVRRFGSENPNSKSVIVIDPEGNRYTGRCIKELCEAIFGSLDLYHKMKHMIRLCERGSKPRKDSAFYGWQGSYIKE